MPGKDGIEYPRRVSAPTMKSKFETAAWAYAFAVTTFWVGVIMAARLFPHPPYDWMYTVVSTLASKKHNPEGGRWFSIALGISMLALWPVVSQPLNVNAPRSARDKPGMSFFMVCGT